MKTGIIKVFIAMVIVLNFPRSGDICVLSGDDPVKADNIFLENIWHCNIMRLIPENAFGDTLLAGEKGEKRVSEMSNNKEPQERTVEQDSCRGGMVKVALIVIFVWLILGIYLFIIDRRVSRLEKMIDEL
jgi:CcmD family protein